MKPKTSPLQIIDYSLTELEYRFIPPESITDDPSSLYSQYELDIDFGMSQEEFLQVFIKAEINRSDNPLPGYSLLAEATCIFRYHDAGLTDTVRRDIEGFSTIYIGLNILRGLISNITANAPFGRYILPSIDLNDLIDKKRKALPKKIETKKTAAKAARKIKSK